MITNTLTGWTNKFLQKLNTLTSQDKIDARALIDAASATDTAAALATKQPLDSDLTAYANAADAAARRALIGAASTGSPNFTSPTCVTPDEGNNSSLVANTAFVHRVVLSMMDRAVTSVSGEMTHSLGDLVITGALGPLLWSNADNKYLAGCTATLDTGGDAEPYFGILLFVDVFAGTAEVADENTAWFSPFATFTSFFDPGSGWDFDAAVTGGAITLGATSFHFPTAVHP